VAAAKVPARGKVKAAKGARFKAAHLEYHIIPDGERWHVERDDAYTGSFAYDVNTAIGLATAAALRDKHNGLDVSVCVQQVDGSCRHVWP